MAAIALSVEVWCACVLWRAHLHNRPDVAGFNTSHKRGRWRFSLWMAMIAMSVICVLLARLADSRRFFGFSIMGTVVTDTSGNVWAIEHAQRNGWLDTQESQVFVVAIQPDGPEGARMPQMTDIHDPIQGSRILALIPQGKKMVLRRPGAILDLTDQKVAILRSRIDVSTFEEFVTRRRASYSAVELAKFADERSRLPDDSP